VGVGTGKRELGCKLIMMGCTSEPP
jgi:hypothetical protein